MSIKRQILAGAVVMTLAVNPAFAEMNMPAAGGGAPPPVRRESGAHVLPPMPDNMPTWLKGKKKNHIFYKQGRYNFDVYNVRPLANDLNAVAVGVTGVAVSRCPVEMACISGITGDGTLGISIAAGTATDLAGNSAPASSASTTFTVDNTAPTIALL